MMRSDDRLRDKDESDILVKIAELEAKYGTQVDLAEIRALQERDRELTRLAANGQLPQQ
jgi:hypothetical protein